MTWPSLFRRDIALSQFRQHSATSRGRHVCRQLGIRLGGKVRAAQRQPLSSQARGRGDHVHDQCGAAWSGSAVRLTSSPAMCGVRSSRFPRKALEARGQLFSLMVGGTR